MSAENTIKILQKMEPFLLVTLSLISIVWSLFFLPAKFIRLKLYKVKDRSIVSLLSNKIKDNSIILEDGEKPCGFFVSLKYVGYSHNNVSQHGSDMTEIYILTTKKVYESLTKRVLIGGENATKIKLYYRTINYFCLNYMKRDLALNIKAKDIQSDIVSQIKTCYDKSEEKSVVAYIHGEPGSGKSTVPLLLAHQINGSYCKSFDPTDPGDLLDKLYATVSPTKEKPLVLCMEEIDVMINRIHNRSVVSHKHIHVPLRNKESWNSLFDDLKRLYPYLIVIMTSNVHPETIDAMDKSYLRKGRVDIRIKI